jgi:TatD DNase family protein
MQMQLASRLSCPVVIHDREAHGDVMDMIRKYSDVRGIPHSYSGSPEMAAELVRRGWTISFSGTLTFTNARKVREAALAVPRESVIIETDCPYLAPHPHRGKLNHSGLIEYTNRALAEILGVSEEECAELTEENARRIFGI